MTQPQISGWQAIQNEVLRRIHSREWQPGQDIPNEVDLARELGCARATVNRALRALAEAGILERRRKAGTRVALHPVSRATLEVPVIRKEVEDRGMVYSYELLLRETRSPPAHVAAVLCPDRPTDICLHIAALHHGDGATYMFEDRWINLTTAPAAETQDFEVVSANEWLLANVPYTHGDITLSAQAADSDVSGLLKTDPGVPLFVIERVTWDHDLAVTQVRLNYAPGYSIRTQIAGVTGLMHGGPK